MKEMEELRGVTQGLLQAVLLLRTLHPDPARLKEGARHMDAAFADMLLDSTLTDTEAQIARDQFRAVFQLDQP